MSPSKRTEVMQRIAAELSILLQLDHPNVIKLYETYETEDSIYLILEYCSGGEMFASSVEFVARFCAKSGVAVLHSEACVV